jgi:DNA-binding GntR family transcriptional regulator
MRTSILLSSHITKDRVSSRENHKGTQVKKNLDFRVEKENLTLRGKVEEKIRSAIREGHFEPGERLIERELCELLDVSRTSVREALRHLEAQGLIQIIPHKGPVVATIKPEEARQLYELRALLEGYAGEQFALNGTQETKSALGKAVSDFAKLVNSRSKVDLLEGKAAFYKLLLQGSGNVFVAQTLESLYERIAILRNASMSRPGRLDQSIRELREIAKAIEVGDSVKAGDACRVHIRNAADAALESP